MEIYRHPALADDIRKASLHYGEISERVLDGFWAELDGILASVIRNPRMNHFDSSGLRRVNLKKYSYHLLYEVDEERIYLIVLRHDRRHPGFGIKRIF